MTGRLLIVSNRLPITIRVREGQLQIVPSAGGVATGLRTFHSSSEGLWIGWPGELSRLSSHQRAEVARQLQAARIVPVPLTAEQVRAYYEGFANGVIWPLFHYLLDRAPLDSREWGAYQDANQRFADAVAEHYRDGDAIWIHDYQLMLVPGLLRHRLPHARIGFFLHIPFPSYEVFRTLPWRQEILHGLLGADLIGFHTFSYVRYFTRALRHLLGLDPQLDRIAFDGRDVRVRAFPMGIDTPRFEQLAAEPRVEQELASIREDGRRVILGVDRLDYTKGIPRRLLAFQRVLERNPPLRDRLRLIQVAVPSRVGVEPYQKFRRHLDELVGRINGALGTSKSMPIHYLYRSVPPHQLVALYRAADVMLVTALRDGMNLVAKEFVASRIDEDGVLVLSEFAGAAEELTEAVTINPYDIDACADAIERALEMPRAERAARMRALRQRVRARTVHVWAEAFLGELERTTVPAAAAAAAANGMALSRPEDLVDVLRGHRPLVLLLDYDGTLVPLASLPDLASPDPELAGLLDDLAASGVQVHVVSGRSREDLTRWFGDRRVALWAEHGAWQRQADGEWTPTMTIDREWMPPIREILKQFTACTPGALIEEKGASIAWHYRTADLELGPKQALELKLILVDALHNQPLDILEGSKVIEVRPRGVNKARVVERILLAGVSPQSLAAIGDDRTDEEMFAALPPGSTAIHVGAGPTGAGYRVATSADVRALLRGLAAAGARR